MQKTQDLRIAEAFNSMLRTDYISLDDTEKLNLLDKYYVDSFGYLPQILSESDQLVVGRRGTGKTTLLYRAFVECIKSWEDESSELVKHRTLGIYIDLSKCQSLESSSTGNFSDFEHMFVTELCECITNQLNRFWPILSTQSSLLARLFRRGRHEKKVANLKEDINSLATLLRYGKPRLTRSGTVTIEDSQRSKETDSDKLSGKLGLTKAEASLEVEDSAEAEVIKKVSKSEDTKTWVNVSDILRILSSIKVQAEIPAIFVFIDEFSSLSKDLQLRFTSLLRSILGTHSGVYLKLCAITDYYTLGTSIILQRDLFEISLDLDAYVERNGALNRALAGLKEQASEIVRTRLSAYGCPKVEQILDNEDSTWELLSLEAMGVPRTLGIVLQQAWNRRRPGTSRIRKSDLDYGIRYASKAYLNQLLGASRDSLAIPSVVSDLWYKLLERAGSEKKKERGRPASHFLILPKNEESLKYLNMFFLVHLLTKGRTTKKDSASRSLYCFDYGVCLENNLDFTKDKNVLRQQRFAYDDTVEAIEFSLTTEPTYICDKCSATYRMSELTLNGKTLRFCPEDASALRLVNKNVDAPTYTEEEIKIIGAIRNASPGDGLLARQIADDVGCNVQKVSRFFVKLEKNGIASRRKDKQKRKMIYYGAK